MTAFKDIQWLSPKIEVILYHAMILEALFTH